jgi:hypothetical protein
MRFLFRPQRTVLHHYTGQELSGPLPDVLYKVLPRQFAETFLQHGEMMWSTLAWFQYQEDPDRGDALEGTRRYFPAPGLRVTRVEPDGRPGNREMLLPNHGLQLRARRHRHIFIYSTTTDPGLDMGDVETRARVKIFNPSVLLARLREVLKAHPRAKPATLLHDSVQYWAADYELDTEHSLPHRLVLLKHESYRHQREYRFAFGIRNDVFDFDHVDSLVSGSNHVLEAGYHPGDQGHRLKLRLGALHDCCQITE